MSQDAAAARTQALIALTERLTERMARQAAAFEANRPQDALPGMAEVTQLANAYRHESALVRDNPGLVSPAPAALRQRLVRATEAFDAVMARHARALHAVKTVTEGIVRAVAEEVAASRASGTGYGPGAQTAQGAATAITLNRRA